MISSTDSLFVITVSTVDKVFFIRVCLFSGSSQVVKYSNYGPREALFEGKQGLGIRSTSTLYRKSKLTTQGVRTETYGRSVAFLYLHKEVGSTSDWLDVRAAFTILRTDGLFGVKFFSQKEVCSRQVELLMKYQFSIRNTA